MNDTPPTRPNYFTGEALLTADFICEQRYQMDSLARLNRSLHTYGIAAGLEVYWQVGDQANQVQVQPGIAIDGEGRQIVLSQAQVVTFADIQQGAMYYLTICYHEVRRLTASGGCRRRPAAEIRPPCRDGPEHPSAVSPPAQARSAPSPIAPAPMSGAMSARCRARSISSPKVAASTAVPTP